MLRRKKSQESISGPKKMLDYERLSSEAAAAAARSLIPPGGPSARRAGLEYGRLSDGDAKGQGRKSQESSGGGSSRGQSTGSLMSTKSEASTASLQLKQPGMRSIPRPSNYRIQF